MLWTSITSLRNSDRFDMSAPCRILPLPKACDAFTRHPNALVSSSFRNPEQCRAISCDRSCGAPKNRKLSQALKGAQSQRCVLAAAEVPGKPADIAAPSQSDPAG